MTHGFLCLKFNCHEGGSQCIPIGSPLFNNSKEITMQKIRLFYAALLLLMLFNPPILFAKGDLTTQTPFIKNIQLGNKNNALRFYPDSLQFETGKLYKLVISNPSKQKHYFTAEAFADSVFTRKVQVISKNKITLAEIKGTINEIEVYPGGVTQWWFVPIKTLNASQLHCSIKGHTQAGMVGKITIK